MSSLFRIHGDNIVECERIAKILLDKIQPHTCEVSLISPSTLAFDLEFQYAGQSHAWTLELLPGFNKAGRSRWAGNIFAALQENGSFLDETPDAIVTRVEEGQETILYAIEFCSALQAGNQAWQRSGRGFSTGRTGCPYLYIVDFVKYELDSTTRHRKALRFPNAAVPYSYINFSKSSGNFTAQIYVRSEEFNSTEPLLRAFNEEDFADEELSAFMVRTMLGLDTSSVEAEILQKNLNVVLFLSGNANARTNFTSAQWRQLYESRQDITEFAAEHSLFIFHKIITAKGHHGKSPQVLALVDKCSIGLASKGLPFGMIPAEKRPVFAAGLKTLYPGYPPQTLAHIARDEKHLILCMMKGFKPGGEDNRPDRGMLPFAAMLSSADAEIMTYLYGPILAANYERLEQNPHRLAYFNGFWRSILALSDFVALDSPILPRGNAELLLDTRALKREYTHLPTIPAGLTKPVFPSTPRHYQEDDVDTGIHFLFAHLLSAVCFEGMCNPPGGDWSGFSLLDGDTEKRWLSLPRVSDTINGKRPDHIVELFGVFDAPLLLSIESKEKAGDLEAYVGRKLVRYIQHLMDFVPSVQRPAGAATDSWRPARGTVNFRSFEVVSAAAYLKRYALEPAHVFRFSHCELLFVMDPTADGWNIEIQTNSQRAAVIKEFLLEALAPMEHRSITVI